MDHYEEEGHINVGTGIDLSIKELADTVREVVYPAANLVFDTSKPDGMPRKVLDVSKLTNLGWRANTSLRDGIEHTYTWFLEHQHSLRGVTPVPA
jgi:GDP-L-fucose synthase